MTHRYRQPIAMHLAEEQPHTFRWRACEYRVVRVLATWHLRDRWWAAGAGAEGVESLGGTAAERPSDRHYYRLLCVPDLICEIYFDALAGDATSGDATDGIWMLDRVYD